jgi:DNA-binding response OmpR family regulator
VNQSDSVLIVSAAVSACPAAAWLTSAGFGYTHAVPEAALASYSGAPAVLLDAPADKAETILLCRALRADSRFGRIPVFVGAHQACQVDVYEAFAAGANDFIRYPEMSPREFLARLQAHMRRSVRRTPRRRVDLGHVVLDLEAHQVVGRNAASLTPREAAILTHLVGQSGRPATTEELLTDALGYPPRRGNPEVVRTHVRHLREKLEPDPNKPRFLINIPRVGYKLALAAEAL